MPYTAEQDPLCYPGTTVIKNKLDLPSQPELDEFELAVSLTRADEPSPVGFVDYDHYKALHHHLFQDVYEWAGKVRTIRIGKDGNWFCFPEYIDREMERIFGELVAQGTLVGMSAEKFSVAAAHILAEINAVHPFREGNGRTQLAFLVILADYAGLSFDADALHRDRVIHAMVRSFSGDEEPLARLIKDIVSA